MAISFTPVSHLGVFRFWCQKVLPAVYDDSLSYYELLCKIAEALNKEIEVSNKQTEAITELQDWAKSLDGQIADYIRQFVQTDPAAQAAIEAGVREYIESLVKGTTYAELKEHGFLHS